jgi:serine phosphatase RsbU (regulator of sigma subunit)
MPGLLAGIERASPSDAVEVLARQFAQIWHARSVSFLIADYGGDHLVRLVRVGTEGPDRADTTEAVPIHGTAQGQVLRTQQPLVLQDEDADGVWAYAPVSSRGEAIGVLEIRLPAAPADWTRDDIVAAAHVLAYVVVTNRRYTDLYEWGQREVPFDLAAEIQRRLLPPSFTCEAAQFTVAGWLEPARTAAGDTFDYILDRGHLHASMTDAMGHEVPAAQLATLAVAALRQSRRRGATLAEQGHDTNTALTTHARDDQFVTGLLLRVGLATGIAHLVNAGHPPPYRLRGGVVEVLPFAPDPPFGVFPDSTYQVHDLPLLPGDRLLLVTDGMIERNAAHLDIPHELTTTHGLHPRETVQHLIRQVASHGDLQDDATVLCLDWHGPHHTRRGANTGADHTHASLPPVDPTWADAP